MKEFEQDEYPFQPKIFKLLLDREFTLLLDKTLVIATDLQSINFLRGFLKADDLILRLNFNKSRQIAFCDIFQRDQQLFALFNQQIDPLCDHSLYQQFTKSVCLPKNITILESVHSNLLAAGVFSISNSSGKNLQKLKILPQEHIIKGIAGLFLIKSEINRVPSQYILFSFDSQQNRSSQLISLFQHLGKGNLKPLRPAHPHLYI